MFQSLPLYSLYITLYMLLCGYVYLPLPTGFAVAHVWWLVPFFHFSLMQTVIARRSEMLVMSTEGPLGAYVNTHGSVHEIMTLYRANGLALIGRSQIEYSWFPGYGIMLFSLLSQQLVQKISARAILPSISKKIVRYSQWEGCLEPWKWAGNWCYWMHWHCYPAIVSCLLSQFLYRHRDLHYK